MTQRTTMPLRRHRPVSTPDDLRMAAIDVGSNSIHMIIAHVDADGGITTLWTMKEMVGLGRMSFPSRRLSMEAMDRAVLALDRFLQEAHRRQCERVLAVATSAVREAENGGAFIERVRRELGLHVRVVSARDEARLIYLGVRHAADLRGGPHLLFDVGGGSAEFVVASADQPHLLESRKLGAARMTARFIRSDPADPAEIESLLQHYDAELQPLIRNIRAHRPHRVIGTSGTLENLAAMCGSRISSNSHEAIVLRRGDLARLVDQLIPSRSEERAHIKGLDDKRKDQILAGALLVRELFRHLEVKEIELCRSALREGVILDYLSRHRPELQIRRQVRDPRRRSVIDLGRRCHWHQEHAEQVARLTLRLFDQLRPLHGLGPHERELLEFGALLHDVGSLIEPTAHHKHSLYLILHGNLKSLSDDEIRIIANIARYHRKALPDKSHKHYTRLSKESRYIVQVGAALLRLADGLDRTSCSVVTDLRCRVHNHRVDVTLSTRGDPELEIWSARNRSNLFSKVFGRSVVFHDRTH